MLNKILVFKIGGSVLTDKKRSSLEVRVGVLRGIARNIKELIDEGYRFILVHGVGSIGHLLVAKYELHKGIKGKEKLIRLTETQNRVNEIIRSRVLRVLEENGIPAVLFLPSSTIYQENGRIKEFYYRPVQRFFDLGFVPIFSFFMVADTNNDLGLTICSGDQIAFELAKVFNAKTIIFGVDVNGIYDRDPVLPGARLIKRLSLRDAREILEKVGKGANIDVSGGMRGKLREALLHPSFFENGGEVWIFNALRENMLLKVIKGETEIFTRIAG